MSKGQMAGNGGRERPMNAPGRRRRLDTDGFRRTERSFVLGEKNYGREGDRNGAKST
jgi:hypothetical protein